MFNVDAHTAELLEGSHIIEVQDSGNLVVEKEGKTIDVSINGYQLGPDEVIVEMTTIHRRHSDPV